MKKTCWRTSSEVSTRSNGSVRAVIQRVCDVRVSDRDSDQAAAIGPGIVVLLGVAVTDDEAVARRMAEKTVALRVFNDAAGKLNLAVAEVAGSVLVVPNFTVCGQCRRGNRPSFEVAARPEQGRALFEHYADSLQGLGVGVEKGFFGADMAVELTNDGPVTVILEVPVPVEATS